MKAADTSRRATGGAGTAHRGGAEMQGRNVAGQQRGAVTTQSSVGQDTTTKEGRSHASGSALVLVRDRINGWPPFNPATMPAISRFIALCEARCFAERGTPFYQALVRRIGRAERFAREVAV